LAFLRSGDPRFSLEHPPLLNALSALPVLTLPDIRLPFDHPSWERREGWYEFADLLLWQYNHGVTRMIFLARLPTVFLTMGLALIGYRFGGQLWGRAPALIAFLLLLFEPNLLAHGRYATTDLGGTLFSFLTLYLLWRLWQHEGWAWRRWLVTGLVMGLALGSKFSVLVFTPAWFLLAVLPLYPRPANAITSLRHLARRLLQLAGASVLALFVVWIIYGFEWRHFTFVSPQLLPLNNWSGPMPTYWAGIEQISLLSGSGRSQTFLLGQFSNDGFLTYFPIAFLVKTPLIILLLLPVAILSLLRTPSTRRNVIFLLVPVIWFFLITLQSALNIGYRHLLPILPNLLLLVAGLSGSRVQWPGWRWSWPGGRESAIGWGLVIGWSAVVLLLLATLWIHPHYLSFFNLAAGGPANGFQILVDSNVDWGQDLLRLKAWMDDHQVDSVHLAWFGTADPAYYGMQYEPLPGIGRDEFFRRWWDVPFDRDNPQPGVYAISVTNLWELPLREEEKGVFAWFRERAPDDRVGYSILIYDLRQPAGVIR
jgi:4-amino-4-deoxy-L-arabinose transferase-like glycosyltransferase